MHELIIPALFTTGTAIVLVANVIWLGRVAGWWA